MAFILADDQEVDFSVAFADAFQHPAAVGSIPAWASSDETVLAVTAATDGLTATAVPTGALGTAQVSVRADADPGAGVRELLGTLDVEVVAGEAVVATISAGTPRPRA